MPVKRIVEGRGIRKRTRVHITLSEYNADGQAMFTREEWQAMCASIIAASTVTTFAEQVADAERWAQARLQAEGAEAASDAYRVLWLLRGARGFATIGDVEQAMVFAFRLGSLIRELELAREVDARRLGTLAAANKERSEQAEHDLWRPLRSEFQAKVAAGTKPARARAAIADRLALEGRPISDRTLFKRLK
jgi:hypothetical protein